MSCFRQAVALRLGMVPEGLDVVARRHDVCVSVSMSVSVSVDLSLSVSVGVSVGVSV